MAEMIIVLGIMTIISLIGIPTYSKERDRFEFNNALIKTLQLIKTARTYALTSFPIYVGTNNIIPVDGYGVHFKLNTERGKSVITVFANTGSNALKFDLDTGDKILETFVIPKQIDFRYFYFDGDKKWKDLPANERGPTAREGVIIFKPPLGEMTLGNNDAQSLEELGLQFENPASDAGIPKKCQTITIDRIKRFPELIYRAITPPATQC